MLTQYQLAAGLQRRNCRPQHAARTFRTSSFATGRKTLSALPVLAVAASPRLQPSERIFRSIKSLLDDTLSLRALRSNLDPGPPWNLPSARCGVVTTNSREDRHLDAWRTSYRDAPILAGSFYRRFCAHSSASQAPRPDSANCQQVSAHIVHHCAPTVFARAERRGNDLPNTHPLHNSFITMTRVYLTNCSSDQDTLPRVLNPHDTTRSHLHRISAMPAIQPASKPAR